MFTCDWLVTREALLGEQLAKTLRTVWVIVSRREALTRQRLLTISARETFSMIRLILVGDAALRNDLHALGALGGKVILVARHAVDFILFRYEAFGADGLRAREAEETVLVKLLRLVFHFFHAFFKMKSNKIQIFTIITLNYYCCCLLTFLLPGLKI